MLICIDYLIWEMRSTTKRAVELRVRGKSPRSRKPRDLGHPAGSRIGELLQGTPDMAVPTFPKKRLLRDSVPSLTGLMFLPPLAFGPLTWRANEYRRFATEHLIVPPSQMTLEFRNNLKNVKVGQPHGA
jgi:hypothetical protein